MIFALLTAVAAQASIPSADRPAFVTSTIEAVHGRNSAQIKQTFGEIVEVGENRSSPIAVDDLLGMLSACSESSVGRLYESTFIVRYQCLARRAVAKGCDSGDLFLILDRTALRNSLAVAHTRKPTPDCPPPAPPAPPTSGRPKASGTSLATKGFDDPRDYYRRAKLILDSAFAGNDQAITPLVWGASEIYLYSKNRSEERHVALNGAAIREYFRDCQREGQIEVDPEGANLFFKCANAQLNGRYLVGFEYKGQKVLLVFISKRDSEPAEAGSKVSE